MAKRLPPALEVAVRLHETTAARWRAHRKVCHACDQANRDNRPGMACGAGFRIWQADTRAAHEEARRRQAGAGEEQLALGGV